MPVPSQAIDSCAFCCWMIRIENGNGEFVKETTTRLKIRKQLKATNGSSRQQENLAPRGELRLAPKQQCILVQRNGPDTKLSIFCKSQVLVSMCSDVLSIVFGNSWRSWCRCVLLCCPLFLVIPVFSFLYIVFVPIKIRNFEILFIESLVNRIHGGQQKF